MPPTNVRLIEVDGRAFRTRIKLGEKPPLLIINGIGANLELLEPLTEALGDVETIVFELPGMGETPMSLFPYRMRHLARSIARMLDVLGYSGQVDVLGVSWGGALAQQFAFTCRRRCRKLILVATTPGVLMVPGDCFEMASHFRIGFGASGDRFPLAIERFSEFLRAQGRRRPNVRHAGGTSDAIS